MSQKNHGGTHEKLDVTLIKLNNETIKIMLSDTLRELKQRKKVLESP